MRKHKYLDEVKVMDRPELWAPDDAERQVKWKKQRKKYGFDEREIWSLKWTWHLWLYERLKAYLDWSDINFIAKEKIFEFKGRMYTQKEIIDMMIERLEFEFNLTNGEKVKERIRLEQLDKIAEIEQLWAIVYKAMWY